MDLQVLRAIDCIDWLADLLTLLLALRLLDEMKLLDLPRVRVAVPDLEIAHLRPYQESLAMAVVFDAEQRAAVNSSFDFVPGAWILIRRFLFSSFWHLLKPQNVNYLKKLLF